MTEVSNNTNSSKPKKPFYKRAWFIIIVIVLGISILGAALGSGNDPKNNNSNTASNSKKDNSQDNNDNNSDDKDDNKEDNDDTPVKEIYSVGDELKDGNVRIVYIASGDYEEENQFMQPGDGNKYIFLTFAFINEGKHDESISFYSFDCYADGYACDLHYNSDDSLSASLSAGRQTIGSIYFEVPIDATTIEIEYETNVFTDAKIKFTFEGNKESDYIFTPNTTRTEDAYNVGDVVKSSKVNISYLSCEPYTSDNMFIQPKEGYHFITLTFEFENLGSSDKIVSSFSFHCYADGTACDSTYVRDDNLSGTISAGRKIKGTVTFEVPDNAEVIEVEYDDNVWTSSKIVFTAK
ncbi:MAG: DUF4352 domain-containing protein [Lachnospiraceae bacterium]|nr:DUF4352 domain-containing protein [Lachnospiraceae bacterium]